MPRTPKILVVSPDDRLQAELTAALKGIPDLAPVVHHVAEIRPGIEAARNRRPDLALIEMTTDLRALKVFAEEVSRLSPETTLAAVFSPMLFGPDVSESAILIEAMRAGMQDFLRRPLSRADVEQLIDRLDRRSAGPTAVRLGRIVSFISNKGGVGKSTLAVNVGCGLGQRHPEQVLLIDASLQLGVCANLLDLKPATTLTDAVQQRDRLDETLIRQLAVPHESGLHLLAAPGDAVEAAAIDDDTMSRILTLARRAYDYVLVDTFPMLDQVMMAVLDFSDRAYLVLEAVVPTVLGAVKLLQLLDQLGFPRSRQRIIVNRYTGSTDNLRVGDVAERLGREVDHVLPYRKKLAIAANLGQPLVMTATRWWGFGKAIWGLVGEVEAIQSAGRGAATAEAGAGKVEPTNNGAVREVIRPEAPGEARRSVEGG
ncbi:MAG: AAA family ATPase [Gemmataceae bacterium]|nr:AAA family ATPase [Gemmataceae bacterium]MDW8264063.1 AAA family ATPase [Gemmataceae bacterium]